MRREGPADRHPLAATVLVGALAGLLAAGGLAWLGGPVLKVRAAPMPPALPAPEPAPPRGHVLEAASLARIRLAAGEARPAPEPCTEGRNPFFWPGEPGAASPAPALEAAADAPLTVRLILVGDRRRMAVVNDTMVWEGTRLGGLTVVRIAPGVVILAGEDGTVRRLAAAPLVPVPGGEEGSARGPDAKGPGRRAGGATDERR